MKERKIILITNDDGYEAQGINELTALMRPLGDVIVVAPDSARSGAACSITPIHPVELREIRCEAGLRVVACSGSPVDCVKIAFEKVCPRTPDLVVSGINHGDNASISIHYSGTMGAVIEACMKGIPAIGYSLRTRSRQCDFSPYHRTIVEVAEHVLTQGLSQDVCLNVNFPEVARLQGVRVCRLARGQWSSEWVEVPSVDGVRRFTLAGTFTNLEPAAEDTDYHLLDQGMATVTPIRMDMTSYDTMAALTSLNRDEK